MSFAAAIPAAILDTILAHLATLFLIGANGDADIARQAALRMLVRYNPRNEQEFCLTADIISFEMHALEALGRSDEPDLPLSRLLRLRSGAVSLNREAHRCRQKLQHMQAADTAPMPDTAPQAAPADEPAVAGTRAEAAVELVEEDRKIPAPAGKPAKQGRYGG